MVLLLIPGVVDDSEWVQDFDLDDDGVNEMTEPTPIEVTEVINIQYNGSYSGNKDEEHCSYTLDDAGLAPDLAAHEWSPDQLLGRDRQQRRTLHHVDRVHGARAQSKQTGTERDHRGQHLHRRSGRAAQRQKNKIKFSDILMEYKVTGNGHV